MLDTILDNYCPPLHDAFKRRFSDMTSDIMRLCYTSLVELIANIRMKRVPRSELHTGSCLIIAQTVLKLTGKPDQEDPMQQDHIDFHIHAIKSKLYQFYNEIISPPRLANTA